jgi:hypothetical protein
MEEKEETEKQVREALAVLDVDDSGFLTPRVELIVHGAGNRLNEGAGVAEYADSTLKV